MLLTSLVQLVECKLHTNALEDVLCHLTEGAISLRENHHGRLLDLSIYECLSHLTHTCSKHQHARSTVEIIRAGYLGQS